MYLVTYADTAGNPGVTATFMVFVTQTAPMCEVYGSGLGGPSMSVDRGPYPIGDGTGWRMLVVSAPPLNLARATYGFCVGKAGAMVVVKGAPDQAEQLDVLALRFARLQEVRLRALLPEATAGPTP